MPRYHRLYIDGTLAEGAERWSTSLAFTSSGAQPESSALSAWADAVLATFSGSTGAPLSLKGLVSGAGSIEAVRAYSYPDVGLPADVAGVSSAAAIAGVSTPTFPPQCSIVLSLLTGTPGASFRGRMYWPHCGGTIDDDQKSEMTGQTFVNNVATFLSSWANLNTGDIGTPAVVSVSRGAVTPVTTLSVGDVIDTQRRRRDALIEVRRTAAVT